MEGNDQQPNMQFTGGMSVLPLDDPGKTTHSGNAIVPPAPKKKKFNKMPFFVIGGFLLIVIVVTTVVLVQNRVKKEDAVVTVEGPASVRSGDSVTLKIHYVNNNPRNALKGASIALHAPEGFVFVSSELAPEDQQNPTWNLGDIVPGTNQTIQLVGKYYGNVNVVMKTTADLTFTPQGANSAIAVTGTYEPAIVPPALTVDIDAPKTLNAGATATYVIDVKNTSNTDYENLVLKTTPPDGLTISKMTPEPSAGTKDTWSFAVVPAGKSAHIEVVGTLTGNVDEQKVFALTVGNSYNQKTYTQISASQVTVMAAPTISVTQSVSDDTIAAGETTNFSVRVKNTGTAAFSNLVLQVDLDSQVLNPSTVAIQNGGVLRGKSIVWDNTVMPELRSLNPNSEFTVTYALASYKNLTPKAKNFSIIATPKMVVGNTTIPGSATTVKIKTQIDVVAKASPFDSNKVPVGNGPTTPQVGQTTTYRLNFTLTNRYNEVTAGKLSCVIPLGATYTKKYKVADGTTVVFDEPTKTLIWNLNTMKAKTETDIGSVFAGYFDVSVTPSAPDAGKEISLTNKCTFTGYDTYLATAFSQSIDDLMSEEVNP